MRTSLRLTFAAFLLAALNASAAKLYVSLDSTNPTPPYTNWATAAHFIQDAVDAAKSGDAVLVTNGVYSIGERQAGWPTHVVVTNSIRLESVNGPLATTITGGVITNELGFATNTLRCVFLGSNALLSGFTLTNGAVIFGRGAGVLCESSTAVVSNCILSGNWALVGNGGGASGGTLYNCMLSGNTAFDGGGAYDCTLNNCTLTGNVAMRVGGGVQQGTLYNCTLTGNSAEEQGGGAHECSLYDCTLTGNVATNEGGGAFFCNLNNCIVYYNYATNGANYSGNSSYPALLNYCCATPMPTNGVGNITNEPAFMNLAAGDLRLCPNSPCIDAGTNLSSLITTDILGLPRPMDGNNDGIARCDIGAYEFNPYRFGPTLHLSASGFHFTVYGEPNRSVRLEQSRDLAKWEHFATVPIPASGQTLIDPVATSEPRLFYRAMRVP